MAVACRRERIGQGSHAAEETAMVQPTGGHATSAEVAARVCSPEDSASAVGDAAEVSVSVDGSVAVEVVDSACVCTLSCQSPENNCQRNIR